MIIIGSIVLVTGYVLAMITGKFAQSSFMDKVHLHKERKPNPASNSKS